MTTSSSYLGVVFDLDGVLIDSHDQHEGAWFALAEEIGKPMTKDLFKRCLLYTSDAADES